MRTSTTTSEVRLMAINTCKGWMFFRHDDIVRIEAVSNYCKIHFAKGHPLTVAKLLYWFEHRLPRDNFYRIHRTHIVNRLFVADIPSEKLVELSNGEQLQVSRRKKGELGRMAMITRL